jgi:hypothetical protein
MHITTKRMWDGENKYCTEISVQWYAAATNVGVRRIMASLDRLESWGVISRIKDTGCKTRLYKYNTSRINTEKLQLDVWEEVTYRSMSTAKEAEELVKNTHNEREKEEEEVVQQ